MLFKDIVQSADWKTEKHVPVIDVQGEPKAGEAFTVNVSVGKEIKHPNTTEHHIEWIELYFKPSGGKFPYLVARCDFAAHGASAEGANTSGVYAEPSMNCVLKVDKGGTLLALSYCNIHGLWESSVEFDVK